MKQHEHFMLKEWKASILDIVEGRDPIRSGRYSKHYARSYTAMKRKGDAKGETKVAAPSPKPEWPNKQALLFMSMIRSNPNKTLKWIEPRIGIDYSTLRYLSQKLQRTGYLQITREGPNAIRALTNKALDLLSTRREELDHLLKTYQRIH